ncbi:flagellar basal-body rod protein FlgF [Rhodopseudomonas thermotolerans]|jgi:flagellar basal-body rod protein FlgF|uniref:Flagellar basal-body rod protein FlgF n=2 Tax=Rhodopseudomonas TaxID=1073 RepID=A0A336JQ13_9BRAD|nr:MULTISPECIES: flagellar basal-body rod protein FlgF [Rhodopseudomonas]RED38144.1 flagellar basal-body rod protein FlgF [Rhodopseudomonas pentothenatexigens]REG05337.1 flagellar basal-body rod protein FlgF [Rhodopseudomonas thermotolerans]SSW90169.1 flagellar basal-body rod protein FlgF [Rhodopseudomonas pentothenatexigens]
MENALLVGLSRQVVLERQMDVVANNLANISTTGFKAERSMFQEFLNTGAHEDNFARPDRRISFVQDRATFHDLSTGPLEQTKNPLDVAIDGQGFLVVQTPQGERFTRDGSLKINAQGQLVNGSGFPVLGTGGPIVIQPTDKEVSISPDGRVSVLEGTSIIDSLRGKLRVVSFDRPQSLIKEGGNLFAPTSDQGTPDIKSVLRQGYVEKSNVNSVLEMTRMIEVTRTYTQISAMLQQQSELRKSAIEKLGEVPA